MVKDEFLKQFAPMIVAEARARGYIYPSAILAQAACESNWNRSELSRYYYNYFGMKCGSYWKGKSVNMKTKEEYVLGCVVAIKDNFRVYDSPVEGIRGYFDFISMKRYSNLRWASSPIDYIQKLKWDGWATSSKYIKTLTDIIYQNGLTIYDMAGHVAQEVIDGLWGVGEERKQRLEKAGYNYRMVQDIVNYMVKM